MCHFNLDVNTGERSQMLPAMPGYTPRILIFTTGMTEFSLPRSYGIPVSSDETWNFMFQALNLNLDGHFAFRHRVTLYFNRHHGLISPMNAVMWAAPFIAPPIDGVKEVANLPDCACCALPNLAVDAPANFHNGLYKMPDGRTATGHWIVPPGKNSWSNPVRYFSSGFDQDRKLVAAWAHIHSFCETLTLRAFDKGCSAPREVFTSHVQNVKKGIGLAHIETLSADNGGIPMPASSNYELQVTYNNTSGQPQTSMAVMGLYMTAPEWRLPEWATIQQTGDLFCGIPNNTIKTGTGTVGMMSVGEAPKVAEAQVQATAAEPQDDGSKSALFNRLPSFTGPASPEDKPYRVEMVTSKGTIIFQVQPSWAPKTAAALKPLFSKNLYGGRDFISITAGFIVQAPEILPETVADADRTLLYRLPVETKEDVRHEPGVLSMTLWSGHPESATSGFSFVLTQASQLDGKYTIFGKVDKWEESQKTFAAIQEAANRGEKVTIVKTQVLDQKLVASSGTN